MPSRTIEGSHRPRVSDRTMHCHSRVDNHPTCSFRKRWAPSRQPNGHHRKRRSQSVGPNSWAECREKKIGIEPKGSTFLLTFPLIGLIRLPDAYRDLAESAGLSALGSVHNCTDGTTVSPLASTAHQNWVKKPLTARLRGISRQTPHVLIHGDGSLPRPFFANNLL